MIDEKGSGGVWDQSIDYVVEFLRLRGFTPDSVDFDLMVDLLYNYIKYGEEIK